MGFRNYSPGLNRFTTRDMYNGALANMNLGTDPMTANRYAFTAGNPINRIEFDGHRLACGGEGSEAACPEHGAIDSSGKTGSGGMLWTEEEELSGRYSGKGGNVVTRYTHFLTGSVWK